MTANSIAFRKLHENPAEPLLLANAWDAGSARIVENLGAKAIATTSAGVGWALGYPDGNVLPLAQLENLVLNILRVVKIPLSVDFEGGYSDDPSEAAENLKPLLNAGIVGINIEDGTGSVDILEKKIEKIKSTSSSLGINLFVNARTDVYLQGLVPESQRKEETIKRAARYRAAGADGLFVPALIDKAAIKEVVGTVQMPVNLIAWPGLAGVEELANLGVRRLSSGAGIPQIIWNHTERLAKAFLETGNSEIMAKDYMAHSKLQGLFA